MNFSLILCTVKNIFYFPVCHCSIQLLHITEFLDGNYSAVRTIWQRNFSGITLRKLLRQDYLPPAVNIVIKNVGKYARIFYIILSWDVDAYYYNST